MLQIIKRCFWIVLLATSWQAARGFSLLGPLTANDAAGGEPWQVFAIGYGEGGVSYFGAVPGAPYWFQDIGGPHNLGEEYRRNTKILYYTYDPSFVEDYFGLEAITNIDGAFAILNSLTNVDRYSGDLHEFPMSAQEYNYTAQALYLTDMKSMMLHLLVEQLGLADAARYTWTLHDRFTLPGTSCPVGTVYMVIQRNFDVVPSPLNQVQYSAYVNGQLLSYYISEFCTGSSLLGATVPYLTDPAAQPFDPVAANTFMGDWNDNEFNAQGLHIPTVYGLQIGGYYSGLTRDDVAGLRYLLSTNNINQEPIPATSLLLRIVTNGAVQATLPSQTNGITLNQFGVYSFDGTYGYGDYGALIAASMTNSPAVIQAAYPGIVIATSSNYFVLATNYTFRQYFTNSGAGTTYPPPLTLVTVSNANVFLLEKFVTTFANVFPNKVKSTTTIRQQTTVVQPQTGVPFPAPLVTNTTTKAIVLNIPSGDFFVLPLLHTNVCPIDIIAAGLTNVFGVTNLLTGSITNIVTPTNSSTFSSTLIQIISFTNTTYIIHPVTCDELAGAPRLFQGIGRIQFKRVDFDSLFGQSWDEPITNYYTMVSMTNFQLHTEKLVRVVTTPDILIQAADIVPVGNALGIAPPTVIRTIPAWNSTQIIPGLRGPGIMDTPVRFVFNKVGPMFFNGPFLDGNSLLNPTEVNETTQMQGLQWASYDGTTNDPIVYPNGTSIIELQNQMLTQLTSTPLGPLVGTVGVGLNYQFHAFTGTFPSSVTWSASGSPAGGGVISGLPPGVFLTSDGLLTGTPLAAGTYDFTLTANGSGKTVHWNLSITIN